MKRFIILLKNQKNPFLQYADRYERTTEDGLVTYRFYIDDVEKAIFPGSNVIGISEGQPPPDEPQEPNDGEGGPKGPGPNRQRVQRMLKV